MLWYWSCVILKDTDGSSMSKEMIAIFEQLLKRFKSSGLTDFFDICFAYRLYETKVLTEMIKT